MPRYISKTKEPTPPPSPVVLAVTEATGVEPRDAAREVWESWAATLPAERMRYWIGRAERLVREQGHGKLTLGLVKALAASVPGAANQNTATETERPPVCCHCHGREHVPVVVCEEREPGRVDCWGYRHGQRVLIQAEPVWPVWLVAVPCPHDSTRAGARRLLLAAQAVATAELRYAMEDECLRLFVAAAGGKLARPPEGNARQFAPTSSRDMMRRAAVALAETTGESRIATADEAGI